MIYLLILTLIVILIISIKQERNIYNPLTVFSSIWLVITVFNSLKLYGLYSTSLKAYALLLVGIVAFVFGFVLSKLNIKKTEISNKQKEQQYEINWNIVRLLIFVGIIFTGILSIKVITLIIDGVPYSQIRSMYYSYGDSIPLISNPTLFTLYDWVTSSLIYSLTFIIVCSLFYNKEKDKKTIIGMFIFFVLYIFSTAGRSALINLLISIVLLTLINYKKLSKKNKKKIMYILIGTITIIFAITGIRNLNKTDTTINNAYSYFSISMPMFSFWIDYIDKTGIMTYGYATLYGFYLIVQKIVKIVFGIKFSNAEMLFEIMNKPQTAWLLMFNDTTERFNAYTTMFYNFYLDFRLPGIIIITILYSWIITKMYQRTIKKEKNIIDIYLYMILVVGLINSFIKWQFSGVVAIVAMLLTTVIFKRKKQFDENKVLVFGITDNPGGVESVIMNYYRHINKDKIQFDFLCNTKKVVYEDEIETLGGNVYRITARSKNIIKYYIDLYNFYKNNAYKYKAIWVNVCSLANIDYLIFAKIYNIPIRIIHSHNSQNMDSKIRGIVHKLNRFFIDKWATDYWSCSTQASLWFYSNKILKSPKYKMINNAIDLDTFKFSKNKRTDYRKKMKIEKNIVYANIGRLHFQKNQLFLLDIFAEIKKIQPNAILLIIGQGEEEENLKEKIKKLKIEKSVKLLGIRNDIPDILNAVDYMIFPSLFEGLSLTLLEAQASGLPIFVSNTCDSQTNMSPEYYTIDLSESSAKWAEIITNYKVKHTRDDNIFVKSIESKGFNIKTEVNKLERFLGD